MYTIFICILINDLGITFTDVGLHYITNYGRNDKPKLCIVIPEIFFTRDFSVQNDKNSYPKHVGHASIIPVASVEFGKVCPWLLPNKLQWHSSVAN